MKIFTLNPRATKVRPLLVDKHPNLTITIFTTSTISLFIGTALFYFYKFNTIICNEYLCCFDFKIYLPLISCSYAIPIYMFLLSIVMRTTIDCNEKEICPMNKFEGLIVSFINKLTIPKEKHIRTIIILIIIVLLLNLSFTIFAIKNCLSMQSIDRSNWIIFTGFIFLVFHVITMIISSLMFLLSLKKSKYRSHIV